MSLRKSPQLTPELVAAARRKARHFTGPLHWPQGENTAEPAEGTYHPPDGSSRRGRWQEGGEHRRDQ